MESMKIMKSNGPRMEPWGTPEVTGVGGEDEPSRTTLCSLPNRYVVGEPGQEGARDSELGQ